MKQLLILKPHILRGYVHRIQTVFWFVLLWVTTAFQLDAQTTLNGSLQLLPPYPAYLLDYTNTSAERAVLTLTSTNFEASSQRVRLKMLLEKGNSLMAYSSDAVIGEPTINLTPNIPVRLGTQLAPYFRLENLQGMSPDMYNRLLPEGMYRVTFEVYDYMTNTRMGSFSQQMWLVLNEPPQLNMPRNAENIQQTTTTATINFQWLPRAVQSASLTDYEFTLVEILDDYGNPVQQFMSSAPKYTTTVQTTTLALNPLSVNGGLIAGRTYAWRVRAKARQGVTTIALYKNDGYSDIFTFKYNGACAVPTGLQAQAKAYDQINLTWSPSSVHSSYRVAYRKYSTSTNWDWVEQTTSNTFLNLTGLEASTQYEIKVGGVCGPQLVSFTPSVLTTTLAAGQVNGVSCGTSPTINITNQALQPSLYINDVIMAGDFPVTLTQVTGSNGIFSGTGYVKVPWLADTKIKVSFNGIKVNTDKKLIGGNIETTYNPNGGNIADLDKLIASMETLLEDLKSFINSFTGTTDQINKAKDLQQKYNELSQNINSLGINSSGMTTGFDLINQGLTGLTNSIGCNCTTSGGGGGGNMYLDFNRLNTLLGDVACCIQKVKTGQEKVESELTNGNGVIESDKGDCGTFYYVTPSGSVIKLASNIKYVRSNNAKAKYGALSFFMTPEGVKYEARFSSTSSGEKFCGYGIVGQSTLSQPSASTFMPADANIEYNVVLLKEYDSKVVCKSAKYKPLNWYPLDCNSALLSSKPNYVGESVEPCREFTLKIYRISKLPEAKLADADLDNKLKPFEQQYGTDKLLQWLQSQKINAALYIVVGDKLKVIQNTGVKYYDDINYDNIKRRVNSGLLYNDVAICVKYDPNTGKLVDLSHGYLKDILNPNFSKYNRIYDENGTLRTISSKEELVNAIKDVDNEKVAQIIKKYAALPNNTKPEEVDADFYYASLKFFEAIIFAKNTAIKLVNEAKIPEPVWHESLNDYQGYPIHAPALLSGATDQLLQEALDLPQFVATCLDIATDFDKAKEMWQGVKGITPEKVKEAVTDGVKDKINVYTGNDNTLKSHIVGSSSVTIIKFIAGGGLLVLKSYLDNLKNLRRNLDGGIAELYKKKLDEIRESLSNEYKWYIRPGQKSEIHTKSGAYSQSDVDNVEKKYKTKSVCYDDLGFPDFSDFVFQLNGMIYQVEIDNMSGGDESDFAQANAKMREKLGGTFNHTDFRDENGVKYTWHHHQDGKTMQLIPSVVNGSIPHVGGNAIVKKNIEFKGTLPDPEITRTNFRTICK